MLVFDSCIWIYAVTQTCPNAVDLVDTIIYDRDAPRVAVSAYIFNEVIEGITRSAPDNQAMNEAHTRFSEMVHDNQRIIAPPQDRVEAIDLHEVRRRPYVRMMATSYDIQPKDVPVVYFAYQHADDTARIYTSDEDLGQFTPSLFDLDSLAVEYVDCTGY